MWDSSEFDPIGLIAIGLIGLLLLVYYWFRTEHAMRQFDQLPA